ncbi:MAG: DUF255 domain-containing protein [Cyclobacteriaceae bacterium]
MNSFIFTVSLALISLINSQNQVKWVSFDEAQEFAKSEPRKVFVDIYADWCGWCKVMDRKTFSNKNVANYINENYYAVRVDAESNNLITFNGKQLTEKQFVQSLNVSGLPTIVFIDENFKKVKPVTGYQDAKQFLKSLQKFNK